MSPKSKTALIAVLFVLVLYYLARAFHLIDFYRVPSSSMEPTYERGSYIIASNLKQLTYNSVITFKDTSLSPQAPVVTFMGRIVAMGGDVMEMRDGFVYVNGKNTHDLQVNLKHAYQLGEDLISQNRRLLNQVKNIDKRGYDNKTVVHLSQDMVQQFSGKEKLVKVNSPLYNPEFVKSPFPNLDTKNWTFSNFSPLKIPDGSYFILGDNRHQSEDSRFRGFVPEEDVLAVVSN